MIATSAAETDCDGLGHADQGVERGAHTLLNLQGRATVVCA